MTFGAHKRVPLVTQLRLTQTGSVPAACAPGGRDSLYSTLTAPSLAKADTELAGVLPNKEHVGVVGFMLRYFRQEHETAVLAALKAEHERLAATGALFLSEADRAAQLERIDTELYVLGVHEELTVLRLESGDRKVLRRADALPRPCSAPYSRD